MAVVPNDCAEVWTQFTTAGDTQAMYTVMGVEKTTTNALSQAEADQLLQAAADALANMVSSTYAIGPGHVMDGVIGGTNRLDGTITPQFGALAAACLPQNCAYLFRKVSGLGGRKNRGRGYIPGIPEGDVSSVGIVSGATMAAFVTAMNDYQVDLEALSFVNGLVILHDSALDAPTPIIDLSAKTTIATQRRRLRP